jgi:hypothetical protein
LSTRVSIKQKFLHSIFYFTKEAKFEINLQTSYDLDLEKKMAESQDQISEKVIPKKKAA